VKVGRGDILPIVGGGAGLFEAKSLPIVSRCWGDRDWSVDLVTPGRIGREYLIFEQYPQYVVLQVLERNACAAYDCKWTTAEHFH